MRGAQGDAGAKIGQALPYVLLLAATVWLWTVSSGIQYDARPGELGPDFWPRAALVLMGAISAFQIGKIALSGANAREATGISDKLDAEEADDEAPRRPALLVAGIALTVLYAALLGTIGFPIATAAFLVAFMYLGGSRSHLAIWTSSLIGVAITAILLMKVVYVSLPRGIAPFDRVTDLITGF